MNAMLNNLSGRDGTRIWKFIFSVTTLSYKTMYCIFFLHVFPFSKSYGMSMYYFHD